LSARTKLDLLKPRPKWIRSLVGYLAFLVGIISAKTVIRGRHHLPKEGPFIIAINHFNYADPPFVIYAVRRPIDFLAASDQVIEWFNYWAIWLYGFIPTNRTTLAPSTIKRSRKILSQKGILGIFPEGDTLSDELRPAKGGVVYLSTTMQVPIVPMSIYGLKDVIWSYLARGVRPKVRVNFGKPFGPYKLPVDKKKKGEALKNIGDEVMCRIAALLPEESHGEFKGNPKIEEFRIQNNMTSEY
tara:strand:+ start:4400 stop:5128 length:729 start_codon:yes stop_codon:yes gene_type:complete